jgi:hypothetical protein
VQVAASGGVPAAEVLVDDVPVPVFGHRPTPRRARFRGLTTAIHPNTLGRRTDDLLIFPESHTQDGGSEVSLRRRCWCLPGQAPRVRGEWTARRPAHPGRGHSGPEARPHPAPVNRPRTLSEPVTAERRPVHAGRTSQAGTIAQGRPPGRGVLRLRRVPPTSEPQGRPSWPEKPSSPSSVM